MLSNHTKKTTISSSIIMFITLAIPVMVYASETQLQRDLAELQKINTIFEAGYISKASIQKLDETINTLKQMTQTFIQNTKKQFEFIAQNKTSVEATSKNSIDAFQSIINAFSISITNIINYSATDDFILANNFNDNVLKFSKEIITSINAMINGDLNNNNLMRLDNNGKFLTGLTIKLTPRANLTVPEKTTFNNITKTLDNIKKELRNFSKMYYDYFEKIYKQQNTAVPDKQTLGQKIKNLFK